MTNGPSIEDRYVWFCVMGWKKPVLNDPRIVDGIATPQDVDAMIR